MMFCDLFLEQVVTEWAEGSLRYQISTGPLVKQRLACLHMPAKKTLEGFQRGSLQLGERVSLPKTPMMRLPNKRSLLQRSLAHTGARASVVTMPKTREKPIWMSWALETWDPKLAKIACRLRITHGKWKSNATKWEHQLYSAVSMGNHLFSMGAFMEFPCLITKRVSVGSHALPSRCSSDDLAT